VLTAATPGHWAVEKTTKPPEGDQPGIDVATVVLSANASKVCATASMLHRNAQVHVASESADQRAIEFSSGSRSASIIVTDLGTRLSQMVVAAAIKPGQNPHQGKSILEVESGAVGLTRISSRARAMPTRPSSRRWSVVGWSEARCPPHSGSSGRH
jgi:hypothetical protein